jgi:hypothetical protein
MLAALLLLSTMAARAQCVPGDNQAAFTVDANFQGTCVVLGIGDYPTATSTHLPNDSISSVRAGANVQVYACRDENFGGVCTVLHGSHPNLSGDPVGNDAITSIKVQSLGAPPPCDPGPLRVAFYVDSNFAGDCKILPIGDYPTATSTGLPNDSVSSIRVGPGAQVTVCVDEYYGGNCAVVTSNVSDMHATTVGNDQLTSAKVRKLGETDFDPRCSDAHATGRFSCRIEQPDVTHAESVVSKVAFAQNDTVYVDGDGCVQTGSHFWSGSTWKRFVNPSGRNSDALYHGLVCIPGGQLLGTDVGNSLTRIEHVVGRAIKVVGAGSSADPLVLHLGYEDDDLSDNGYNEHDDGTEDQCKGDNGNDGGPAHVTVTICRGVATCEAPPSRFPFNVRSAELDVNGLLYNPHWSWQEQFPNGAGVSIPVPKVTLCHYMTKSTMSVLGLYSEPNIPDCTDQAGADTLNLPADASVNNVACTAGAVAEGGFSGHINWFPITLEGTAAPADGNVDDDWSTSVSYEGKDGSLYYDHVDQTRSYVHSEFDSDETVDNFSIAAWQSARQAVDARGDAQDLYDSIPEQCTDRHLSEADCSALAQTEYDTLQRAIDNVKHRFGGHAIVTGLFGIDGEHGEKSELHPVYAFASNPCLNATYDFENHQCASLNPPDDDVWLMFVRNRGDEGFCSGDVWSSGFDEYTFRLPWRDGMQSAVVDWNKTEFQWSDNSPTRPDVRFVPPLFLHTVSHEGARVGPRLNEQAGVYVTFHLRYPTTIPGSGSSASIPFVDGALHLTWTPTGVTAGGSPTAGTGGVAIREASQRVAGRDEGKDNLEVAMGRLSEADRKKVLQARAQSSSPTLAHRSTIETDRKRIPQRPVSISHLPVAGPIGPAARKNAKDDAFIKSLCEVSHGKPSGLPAAICAVGANYDHR